MKKLLAFLAPLALAGALSACTIVISPDGGRSTQPTTVDTGTGGNNGDGISVRVQERFGVRVSNAIISSLSPDRGDGATYFIGDELKIRITVSRPGYVTLVFYNPDGIDQLAGIPVEAGTNIIPRQTSLKAVAPRGRTFIRALFTASSWPNQVSFGGSYSVNGLSVRTSEYFRNYPEDVRDIAETSVVVR
jgi:hypothetical protein